MAAHVCVEMLHSLRHRVVGGDDARVSERIATLLIEVKYVETQPSVGEHFVRERKLVARMRNLDDPEGVGLVGVLVASISLVLQDAKPFIALDENRVVRLADRREQLIGDALDA